MSIDSLTITPNPVNAQQTFVISVEATPEEVPIPETDFKLATARYWCKFTYFNNQALLRDTGNIDAWALSDEQRVAIIAGFQFPELSGHQIVGASVQTYAKTEVSGSAYNFSARLVADIQDGSNSYTALSNAYSFPLTSSLVRQDTGLIDDAAFLAWINNHANEGYITGSNFGVRLYGKNVGISAVRLKLYYI